jgi:glycosyltransferase involved in cell wall biosynthesis
MNDRRVSCIIPVFNGERYLAETLDSVFAQTHVPFEVIVADDGSTDRSAEIARSYAGVMLLQQANAGHAAARNLGISIAIGDFIAFVDADDLWHPEKLARQLARFDARPELGLVFTHLENFYSPDADQAQRPNDDAFRPVPGYTSVTMLARREVFEGVGLLDVTLAHGNDREWFCRAAEQKVLMEMMTEVLVRRRLHGSNRSAALGDNSRAEYLRILKASLDRRRSASGDVAEYPFHTPRGDSQ